MTLVNMRGAFIQVQRPIQDMDMRAETLIYDFHKFCDDLNEQFRWNMIIKRSNLIDRFLWTGLFAFEQISGFLISFRVSVLHISFVLPGHKITIPLTIKKLFHIFKSGRQLIFLFGIFEIAEAIVTVPIEILFGSFFVNVFAVGNVKTAVIVLRVINAILSGSSIVSC